MNSNKLGLEIYKILAAKEYGYSLSMYDSEGTGTSTPLTAKWIYIKPVNFMVQLPDVEDHERPEMYFWKTQGEMDETLGQLLKRVKQAANQFGIGLTINDFTKENTPKQFSKIIKRHNEEKSLTEGFNGTNSHSYLTLPNARLVVEHSCKINPEVHGSRARNINKLFVECSNGERYLFPNKHLTSAKAMLRHINEGGEWFDRVGTRIKEAYLNLKSLKALSECTNSMIKNGTNRYISELKEELQKMQRPRGYKRISEKYNSEVRVPSHVLEKYSQNLKGLSGLTESAEVLESYRTYATFNYRENKLNESLSTSVLMSAKIAENEAKKIAQHLTKGLVLFVKPVMLPQQNGIDSYKNLALDMSDSTDNETLNIALHDLSTRDNLSPQEAKFILNTYKSCQMNNDSSKNNIIL